MAAKKPMYLGLTGRSKTEIKKDMKQNVHRCYICKRVGNKKDTSVYIVLDNEKRSLETVTLALYPIEKKVDNYSFNYQICQECGLLLDLFDKPRLDIDFLKNINLS
jgi:hypothetical protein